MLHRRHMPIYLVALWVALDLLLVVFGGEVVWTGQIGGLSPLTFLLWGQFVVLTGWLTLGSEGIKTTQAGLLAGSMCVSVATSRGEVAFSLITASILQFLVLATIYGLVLNVPLLIVTSSNWELLLAPQSPRGKTGLWQFNIRDLMIYMALVGLLGGFWSLTRAWAPRHMSAPPDTVLFHVGATLLLSFPIPWSVWAAFAWSRPIHGALVALLVCCFWGVIFERLLGGATPMILLGLLPPLVMVVHLLALQVAGFRLQR